VCLTTAQNANPIAKASSGRDFAPVDATCPHE